MSTQAKRMTTVKRQSIVVEVTEILRQACREGRWTGQMPGERLLAEQIGVSRPTLRLALAQLEKDGWLHTAPGRTRHLLHTGRRSAYQHELRRVALLSPCAEPLMPPFVLLWVDRLRARLNREGAELQVCVQPGCYGRRAAGRLRNLVTSVGADVWLPFLTTLGMQEWFAAKGTPCVLTGTSFPGVRLPSVDIDYRAACWHAVGRFAAAGKKHCALVLPAIHYGGDEAGLAGFRQALAGRSDMRGMEIRHNGTADGVRLMVRDLLKRHPRPDALLVARSNYALAVLGELLAAKIRVPEEVALISRDDDSFLEFAVPAISRYQASAERHARAIYQAIHLVWRKQSRPDQAWRLMPELIPGQSLGKVV